MTYDDAMAFWYGRINYEVKAAGPGDLKLERMRALLRLVGNPHEQFRSIHITGTKGKGSTAAMLASVLSAAGYRTGLFTSPHVVHVEERIQIDGTPIPRHELTSLLAEIALAVAQLGDRPTFFEIGTALGFLHFARRRCALAVVEVGLGGRYDSTNVLQPLVSVITSVGLDHTAQLGHTLDAIAFQKAGIIKHRAPVVSGVTDAGAASVIERIARDHSVSVSRIDREFDIENVRPQAMAIVANLRTSRNAWPDVSIPLLGRHQVRNAALVAETVERLREHGLTISESAIRIGLARTRWPARIEIVSRRPTIILDTAHNEPSIAALLETLRESISVTGRRRLIFAVSSDKAYKSMLRMLAGEFDDLFLTRYGNNPRSVPPDRLAELASAMAPGKSIRSFPTAIEALDAARMSAKPDDLIAITGSFFLAGELRPFVKPE